ncbi:MAG: NAD(P)H-hydrate dehydratase [Coprobacillaceae bacterium]
MYVASSLQMKKYDVRLLEEGYTIETLVDKASDCLLTHCTSYENIVIVSGTGNNGADGVSLAIKLHELKKQVTLLLIGNLDNLSQANQYYLSIAKEKDIEILYVKEMAEVIEQVLSKADVIVDAIFGFGLHSNPSGIFADMITCINIIKEKTVMSVDIPTGLDCDTGIPYENIIIANTTITLTALKQGFLNPASKKYTGEVLVEVLATNDFRQEQGIAKLVNDTWIQNHLKSRDYYGHKGNYGKVLHITGCDQYKGASLLSAKASVYSGSGIVSVCSTKSVLQNLNIFVPEATSFIREDTLDYSISNRYNAILVGCGLGISKNSFSYVKELLLYSTVPLVIDADALTIVAEYKQLLKEYQGGIILTPHMGEFKRFIPSLQENDIIDTAREFAREYGIILVLKGANTLITDGETVIRNNTGNPAMSTAGMGDVLAGMIVSFVGQGYSLYDAAILATYIHGKCGDMLAKDSYTALPSKIVEEIPKVMHSINNNLSIKIE